MYPCGVIPCWDGTAVDLETETERADKAKAVQDSVADLRAKYVTAFKGMRQGAQDIGDDWDVALRTDTATFATVPFSSIQRASHSAIGASATVSKDVSLPGEFTASSETPTYPLGIESGQREVSSIAASPPAGAVTEVCMRLESEPSSSKTHGHNIEAAGINQRGTTESIKNAFFNLPAGAFAGYFYESGKEYTFWNGYNISNPYPPTQDELTGSSFTYMYAQGSTYVPWYKWEMLRYVIAHKTVQAWETATPPEEPTEDLRQYWSYIDDMALFPVQKGSTKHGFLCFAPADIGYIVGDQYDPSDGFFNLIDVSDAVCAEGVYRDRQGIKRDLCHSYVLPSRRVVTSDKFISVLWKNVLQEYGNFGPYSEIEPSAYVSLGEVGEYFPGVSIVTMEGENNRIRQFSSAAPPVLVADYVLTKFQYGSGYIVQSGYDNYSSNFHSRNEYTVFLRVPSPHRVGVSGDTPCVGYGKFFEEIPSGAVLCPGVYWDGYGTVTYRPPGYTLHPGESWDDTQAWCSPDVSVLSDQFAKWESPNNYTVQITARDGMGNLGSYAEQIAGDLSCFTFWKDTATYPAENNSKSLAFVLPTDWAGYVIPQYGDFVSAALSSNAQTPPTSTLESQGSVRLDMNNCTDYEVHILEFSDGVFPVRIPIYRAPEKLLNRTATSDMVFVSGYYVPKVSPVVTGRVVTVDLPQPVKFFVSKIPFSHTQGVAYSYRGGNPIISDGAEEIPDGIIPDRYTGTVYVQVVDTYYNEMQQITVNL
jgi:hypothetical protein